MTSNDSESLVDKELMFSAIREMNLNLKGVTVLTEAASGVFSCTCLMAALAGAERVFAITKDSEWGNSDQVLSFLRNSSRSLGLDDSILFISETNSEILSSCQLVTNLGFVRPIDEQLVSFLPRDAVISLMCEPWEVRKEDVDIEFAKSNSIAVAGTNEQHALVRTFDYLGPLVDLLISDFEGQINGSYISILASDPFCAPLEAWALSNGAKKVFVDTPPFDSDFKEKIGNSDFLVLAHMGEDSLVSKEGSMLSPEFIAKNKVTLVVLAGDLDFSGFQRTGSKITPKKPQEKGRMWITTAAYGAKPVVDLHCAGLKVGQLLIDGVRSGLTPEAAVVKAVNAGYALKC